MNGLLEIVYNKMPITEIEEMAHKGVEFLINDGLIIGTEKNIPTEPASY